MAFVLLRVLLILLLVAANAFFVAAEFALVSVRETRTAAADCSAPHRCAHRAAASPESRRGLNARSARRHAGQSRARLDRRSLHGQHRWSSLFATCPARAVYAHAVAVVLAFTLITYLHVHAGRVVPKSLALQRTERVALAVAAPMDVFMTVTAPFLTFMTAVDADAFLSVLESAECGEGACIHSPEELKLIVTASRQAGTILGHSQEEMIHHALDLENISVREMMVPRPDIFSVPGDISLDEALAARGG